LEMVYPFKISKYARFRVDWKFVQLKKKIKVMKIIK
jgi:hypothetical protein